MKTIMLTLAMGTLLSTSAFATCKTNEAYKAEGWKVHNSKSFSRLYKKIQKTINRGLEKGTIIKDLEGRTRSYNTANRKPVLMHVRTWDDLRTEQDEMFGEYAIMVDHFNPERILEVRFYKNGMKQVVYNSQYMGCVSTNPPMAVNTIY